MAVRAEIYGGKHKKEHSPLKVHILEVHLPAFAEKWGSVGLFAEDAAESIHALMNKLHRRYACIRGDVERDKAMINGLRLLQSKRVASASAEMATARKRGCTYKPRLGKGRASDAAAAATTQPETPVADAVMAAGAAADVEA